MASIKQIWERGVPLTRAWRDFAPSEHSIGYIEGGELFPPDWLETLGKSLTLIFGPLEQKSDPQYNESIARYRRSAESVVSMRTHLIEEIRNGVVIALGYQAAPVPSNKPEHIAARFFEEEESINWQSGEVEAFGHFFRHVRIIRRDDIEPADGVRLKLAPGVKKPQGRPSKKPIIREAIKTLASADPIFCQMPNKTATALVRAEVKKMHGKAVENTPGFSDKTIERILRQYRDENK